MAPKSSTPASTNVVQTLWKAYSDQTSDRLKFIDAFLFFLMLSGIAQFLYCILVTDFPFNAFLAGFSSNVGQFVLTASLRSQVNPENKNEFKEVSPERAFGDFALGSIVLHFFVYNFLGYVQSMLCGTMVKQEGWSVCAVSGDTDIVNWKGFPLCVRKMMSAKEKFSPIGELQQHNRHTPKNTTVKSKKSSPTDKTGVALHKEGTMSRPPSPQHSGHKGYSQAFERFIREETSDWAAAFTLLDTVETYFDSHVDLLQRRLQKHSDRLKMKAEETFKLKDLSGDVLAENFDREFKSFKVKVSARMTKLSASWQSAKVVRTREKVSFFVGVMTLLFSALLFGVAPHYLLPSRFYQYKQRAWHYFLFDLCYYVTILNFIYIWFLPSSSALFVACYCLSHGSLASAVITWRNSLVFHDQDKVTSLFVHIYAPYTFTVIRHFYPNAEARFPALTELPHIQPLRALLLSGGIYVVWQLLYWKFILIDRRSKIESGERTTSFSFLLNDKRGIIGKILSSVPPGYREAFFMFGQLIYVALTELPAVFLLYDSSLWSGIFLITIFGVSVWNGGGFYIEVFGRKFERELEALRKELAETTARSGIETPSLSQNHSESDLSSLTASPEPSTSSLELSPELTPQPDPTTKKNL
ncbi:hypothetical protein DXG01_007429 [Tephrocybe rancida]|nr:hypothetical protein DXG01_007429 [Tephrocybe rancida]